MSNLWSPPKTTWVAPDLYAAADANRVENNIEAVRDAVFRGVKGFGFKISNAIAGQDGVVVLDPGSCFSVNKYPINVDTTWSKNLNTWAAGNGPTFGGVVSGATVAANTWLYIFIVLDPSTGNTEVMIDDNRAGTNITSPTYTEKRLVNSIKTGAAGTHSSFLLVEMYSTGDRTYINPISLMPTNHFLTFNNSALLDNIYNSVTLSDGTYGALLPYLAVEVRLNMQIGQLTVCGIVTDYQGGVVSVPAQVWAAAAPSYYGEWTWNSDNTAALVVHSTMAEVLMGDAGTLYLGMYGNLLGYIKIVPISYIWDRSVQYGI